MTWWKFWENDSDDGIDEPKCTAHHYEEYDTYKYTVGESTLTSDGSVNAQYNDEGELELVQGNHSYPSSVKFLIVSAKKRSKCEHRGCFAEHEKSETVGYIREDNLKDAYFEEIPDHELEL